MDLISDIENFDCYAHKNFEKLFKKVSKSKRIHHEWEYLFTQYLPKLPFSATCSTAYLWNYDKSTQYAKNSTKNTPIMIPIEKIDV